MPIMYNHEQLLGGGGVLPHKGYIGMCSPKGHGFLAVLVINWVSILAILPLLPNFSRSTPPPQWNSIVKVYSVSLST